MKKRSNVGFILFGACAFLLGCSSDVQNPEIAGMVDRYKDLISEIEQVSQEYQELTEKTSRVWDSASSCNGRLTTESGVALSTSDRSSQGSVYFTPYQGATCSLYTGTQWKTHAFTERTLTLSGLVDATNYDVFLYDNSGTLTLELSSAWASNTARTDALATLNGVSVKNSDNTRRYLGTIRTTSTTTTEDSSTKRYVWNFLNRLPRNLVKTESQASWSYATASWRSAFNSSSNRVEFVIGINDSVILAWALAGATGSGAAAYGVGIGLDQTTGNNAYLWGASANATAKALRAIYNGYTGIGYHYFQWVEMGNVANAPTYYSGGTSGIIARVDG